MTDKGEVRKQITCCDKCKYRLRERPYCQCNWCGAWYNPPGNSNGRYCSRPCAFNALRHIADEKASLKRIQKAWRRKPLQKCRNCTREFRPNTREIFCGEACSMEATRIMTILTYKQGLPTHNERACKECGKRFTPKYGNRRKVFCSDSCSKRYERRTSSANHRKRARKYGCYYEPVNLKKILERDDYICGIGGDKTAPKAPLYSARYPSVDHIIPLSVRGPHTPTNLQCACFLCNSVKGATVSAAGAGRQMLLVG